MKKIIFYYTHKESLGHTVRALTLAEEMSKRYGKKVKVYLFQAGLPQEFIHPLKGITKVDIPLPFYSKVHFKGNPVDLSQADYRAEFMLKKIREIKPDIFMTEFFPFGRMECFLELFGILLYLKKSKVRIYASIGYPNLAPEHFRNKERFFSLVKLYDRLFIHTPREFENPYYLKAIKDDALRNEYASLMDGLNAKIEYTGYIFPRTESKERPRRGAVGRKCVLVSRGGGTVYPKLIASAILAKKYLGDTYSFLIAAGPAASASQMKFFRQLIKKHKLKDIYLSKYLRSFFGHLKSCDLSISLAGYNTAVQLLYLNKNSIVVPYDSKNKFGIVNDQVPRALLLRDCLKSRMVSYDNLNAKSLYEIIAEEIARKKNNAKVLAAESFCGAGKTVEKIMN